MAISRNTRVFGYRNPKANKLAGVSLSTNEVVAKASLRPTAGFAPVSAVYLGPRSILYSTAGVTLPSAATSMGKVRRADLKKQSPSFALEQ